MGWLVDDATADQSLFLSFRLKRLSMIGLPTPLT